MLWVFFAVILVLFSWWGYRRAGDASAFFAASRTAGPLLAGLGGTAAGLSAFVFVGGPGLFAAIGAASLWIILSAPLTGALQCWTVGERIVERASQNEILTVPGLIADRFGDGLPRLLAAFAITLGGIATLAVQIKGVAVVGSVLLGVPGWWIAVPTVAATVTYTAAGGMRAGLLAEAAQGLVMAFSALAIAGFTLLEAGGPRTALDTIERLRPELLGIWSSSGATAGIGLFLLFALGTCAQPHYLQKFLMLRNRRSLRWLPAIMTASLLSVLTVWIGVGLGGSALALNSRITFAAPDQLTAALLSAVLPRWLTGVALIAVVSAVMSTAASLLNIVAAALTRDMPLALGRQPGSSLAWPRWATFGTAVAACVIGLFSSRSVAWLGVLGWGTFTAALLPVIVIGLNWSGASRRGAIAALAVGPTVQLTLEALRTAHVVSAAWEPGLTGAAVGCLVMVLLSGGTHETMD